MDTIASAVDLLRLFGDSTRLRLASLLAKTELTVAEITQITQLPQSRVSTHLGKLRDAGVPLRSELEKAWRDFVGWRVNYDAVLLELAAITIAPYAPLSSDRGRLRVRQDGRAVPGLSSGLK